MIDLYCTENYVHGGCLLNNYSRWLFYKLIIILSTRWPWPPFSWTFSELPKRPFSVTAFTFGLLCDCIAKVIPLVVRFLCVRIRRQRSN